MRLAAVFDTTNAFSTVRQNASTAVQTCVDCIEKENAGIDEKNKTMAISPAGITAGLIRRVKSVLHHGSSRFWSYRLKAVGATQILTKTTTPHLMVVSVVGAMSRLPTFLMRISRSEQVLTVDRRKHVLSTLCYQVYRTNSGFDAVAAVVRFAIHWMFPKVFSQHACQSFLALLYAGAHSRHGVIGRMT